MRPVQDEKLIINSIFAREIIFFLDWWEVGLAEGRSREIYVAVCLFAERITVEELLFLVRFSNFNQLPDSIGYLRERGNRTMAAACLLR